MSKIGISITKQIAFRDNTQEFSNVYYYENGAGALPTQTQAEALIDELTALEKAFHTLNATFTFGRCWSQIGTKSQNEMIAQKTLSGTGALTVNSNVDKERAYLFRWRAGNDTRGHAVYLRKWYHTNGTLPGATNPLTASQISNSTGFSTGERSAMALTVSGVSSLSQGGGGWSFTAKTNRTKSQTVPDAHKYLEHHQLGDQWRGA